MCIPSPLIYQDSKWGGENVNLYLFHLHWFSVSTGMLLKDFAVLGYSEERPLSHQPMQRLLAGYEWPVVRWILAHPRW